MTKAESFYIVFDGKNTNLAITESENILKSITKGKNKRNSIYSLIHLISFYNLSSEDLIRLWQTYSNIIAYTKTIGSLLTIVTVDYSISFDDFLNKILSEIKKVNWTELLQNNLSFKVNLIKKGKKKSPFFNPENRNRLKYAIAGLIDQISSCPVDLDNPIYEIDLYIIPDYVFLGIRLFNPNRQNIKARAPAKRVYFHSASMLPLLIRGMINLGINSNILLNMSSKTIEKPILLDPFMGGGGMLIEGNLLGFSTIGIDNGYWICRGARMNLKDVDFQEKINVPWTIIRANSEKIPLKDNSVDIIVTDPPYGLSTSINKWQNLENLLTNVISDCYRVLKPNSRLIIAIPSTIDITSNLGEIKFRILNMITQRVHKSLSRLIFVLEK